MKLSTKLRKLSSQIIESVKILESLDLEQAMETAERMMGSFQVCPEGVQEIVPGVKLEFKNDMSSPNLLPPSYVILTRKDEKWRFDKESGWAKI